MRIIVVSDLPQFVTGGVESQAERLIAAWLEAGHEVICLGKNMRAASIIIGAHSIFTRRITVVEGFGRPVRAASYFASLALLLLKFKHWADIIYVRFLGDAAVTASILNSIGWIKIPLVAVPAGAGHHGDMAYLHSIPGFRSIVNLLDRQCAAINLIAPAMADDLKIAGFVRARLSFIPNGIPIQPLCRPHHSGPKKLIFVGRLHKQKGLDLLLQALSSDNLRALGYIMEIAGDGPEKDNLMKMCAENSLSERVHFLGELAPNAVRAHLVNADIFVLPSRYEGMSNAALEAMECGLPILATRCGGIDRWIENEAGWVVATNNSAALEAALSEALHLDRDRLEAIGQVTRQLAEQHFSIESVAKQYIDLFDDLRK